MLNKCCFCVHLRTGAICIGAYVLISHAINFILGVVNVTTYSYSWPTYVVIFVFMPLAIIVTACMLYGAIKEKRKLILPFLVTYLVILVITICFYLYALIVQGTDHLNQTIPSLLNCALMVYFWVCVLSYYKSLDSENISTGRVIGRPA